MHVNLIGLAFTAAIALVACGGGSSSTTPTPPMGTAPTPSGTDPTLPKQVTVSGQTIWETSAGMPLYVFNGDTAGAGVSNCTGSCATVWPPLMSGATSSAVGDFTIITRSDPSGKQWAYLGKPLYTFASDTANQPPTGNGVQGFSTAIVAGASGGPTSPPGCTGIYC